MKDEGGVYREQGRTALDEASCNVERDNMNWLREFGASFLRGKKGEAEVEWNFKYRYTAASLCVLLLDCSDHIYCPDTWWFISAISARTHRVGD